jgi:hypothetical protein
MEKSQLTGLSVLVLVVALLVVGLYQLDRRFLDLLLNVDRPLGLTLVVVLVGGLLLAYIFHRQWFALATGDLWRGLGLAALGAVIFGVLIIAADALAPYPADTNAAWPNAWLFYPMIGFLAEVIFHLAPLAILLSILTAPILGLEIDRVVGITLLVVAVLEPIFQTVLSFSNPMPVWAKTYMALHILAINLTGLFLFRRFGFLSMYAMRLFYYLIWHILWGYLRLKVLF